MKDVKTEVSRITWIDVCRGIGILLVMYGHVLSSDKNRFLIYSFHMPLFFFLSGWVFKYNRAEKMKNFIIKNIKQIIIPYFIFALATFTIWIIFLHPDSNANILAELGGILRGNGHYPNLEFNSPLWFLPCLFSVKIIYAFVTHFVHKRRFVYLLLALSSALGYILFLHYLDSNIPYSLDIALTALVFFGTGHLWKSHSQIIPYCKKYALLFFPAALVLTYIFALLNFQQYGFQIDMRVNRLNNYFYFYAGAFSGIISMISLSYLINHNRVLEYLGKRTMILFAWHYIIFTCITNITDSMTTIDFAPVKIWFPAIYTVIACSIILVSNTLIKRINTIFATSHTK